MKKVLAKVGPVSQVGVVLGLIVGNSLKSARSFGKSAVCFVTKLRNEGLSMLRSHTD